MYKTIVYFTDLQDNDYAYDVGDVFPRKGLEVSDERLHELSTDENRRKIPLIEFVEDEVKEQEIVEEAPKPKSGKRSAKKDKETKDAE